MTNLIGSYHDYEVNRLQIDKPSKSIQDPRCRLLEIDNIQSTDLYSFHDRF